MKRAPSKTSCAAQIHASIRWLKRTRVEGIRLWGLDAIQLEASLQQAGVDIPLHARKEPDPAHRKLNWLQRAVLHLVAAYRAKGGALWACRWCKGSSPLHFKACAFCAADSPRFVSGVELVRVDHERVRAVLEEQLGADERGQQIHAMNMLAAKRCQPRPFQPPRDRAHREIFSLAMLFRTSTAPADLASCQRCGGESPSARSACAFCGASGVIA